jgi:hypothetical protein
MIDMKKTYTAPTFILLGSAVQLTKGGSISQYAECPESYCEFYRR